MKTPVRLFILLLVVFLAAISANCVQQLQQAGSTATANPTAAPTQAAAPTPTLVPTYVSPHQFSTGEAYALGNVAIDNPYVQKRCIRAGWRDISNVPVKVADVLYMTSHEKAPGHDVIRTLPAAVIVVGNASEAGINVIAYLDNNRVAYIGFVPRAGINATGATYYSTERGVGERIPGKSADRIYENVTILDTGYVQGMNLSREEDMVIRSVAVGNESVKKLIQDRPYVVRNVSIYASERGYPDRYIEAYPVVTIDIKQGGSLMDTIDVLVDGRNGKVVSVAHDLTYDY